MNRWLDEAPQPIRTLWRRGTSVAPAANWNTYLQRPDSSLLVKLTSYITYSETSAHTGPIKNQNLTSLRNFRTVYSPIKVRQKFEKWNTRKECHYFPIMCSQLLTLYADRTLKDWASGSALREARLCLFQWSCWEPVIQRHSVSSKETLIPSYTTVRT